jgi:hypothetical protein
LQNYISFTATDDLSGTIYLTEVNTLFLDGYVKVLTRSAIIGPARAQWRFWTTSSD